MNKLILATTVAIVGAMAFAKPFSSNKPFNEMTEEEKAVRRQEARQNRLEHFGEDMIKPGSQKGRIVFVDCQTVVGTNDFDKVISAVTWKFKYKVECVKGTGDKVTPANASKKLKEIGANLAVFVVECDTCDNLMLVAPESGWAIVNVAALVKGAANDEFRRGRVRKQLLRAYYAVCGAMNSKHVGSVMSAVTKAEDLDRLNEGAPVDVMQRAFDALEARGVTPEVKSFYRRACEQGWAPAPTNAIQKAIWDEIHQMPTKPIRIKPETKKVTE